jgi:hypothetical protein
LWEHIVDADLSEADGGHQNFLRGGGFLMLEVARKFKIGGGIWLGLAGTNLSLAWAGESAPSDLAQTVADLRVMLDTVWVMMTAFLVFFMNLGFALVESGLTRSKNTVNILAKNFIVFAISTLSFYILGWG